MRSSNVADQIPDDDGDAPDADVNNWHQGGFAMLLHSSLRPGLCLKQSIEALDLTVAETANALGVTTHELHDVIDGNLAISPEMAIRLETVIGSTAEDWLHMQDSYELERVRLRKADLAKGLHKLDAR